MSHSKTIFSLKIIRKHSYFSVANSMFTYREHFSLYTESKKALKTPKILYEKKKISNLIKINKAVTRVHSGKIHKGSIVIFI